MSFSQKEKMSRVSTGFLQDGAQVTAFERRGAITSPDTPDQRNGRILGGTALVAGIVAAACLVTGDGDLIEGGRELIKPLLPDPENADGVVERFEQQSIDTEIVSKDTAIMASEGGSNSEILATNLEEDPEWRMFHTTKNEILGEVTEKSELFTNVQYVKDYETAARAMEQYYTDAAFFTPSTPSQIELTSLEEMSRALDKFEHSSFHRSFLLGEQGEEIKIVTMDFNKAISYYDPSAIEMMQPGLKYLGEDLHAIQNAFPNHKLQRVSLYTDANDAFFFRIHPDSSLSENNLRIVRTFYGPTTMISNPTRDLLIKPPDGSAVVLNRDILHTTPPEIFMKDRFFMIVDLIKK